MRKSPRRHIVRQHKREGYLVRSYTRGRGIGQQTGVIKRRIENKPKSFTVNFKYSDRKGDGESVIVIATDYQKALDEAFEEKTDPREPIEVEVIHPSIGRMLRILARGAGKVAVLGAKYTYIAGKTVSREAAHVVAKSYREMRVRRLIEKCYSPDRRIRIQARTRLKLLYPEMYAIADFSKERPRRA